VKDSLYADPYWETDERKMMETDKDRRKKEQEIFSTVISRCI